MTIDLQQGRYDRQELIGGWGREGQERLHSATVFIAGAGGLGSPAALYLAAAGVGAVRICDCGAPELSNLNRQLLYRDADIGVPKAAAARAMLCSVNPDITVTSLSERITDATVASLVGPSDIIIDCLDTFETRHVLNRCAVRRGIPMVHAGIYGLCGQITFLNPPHSPCLACFYSGTTGSDLFPVAGPIAGIIGSMEALEAVKWIVGIGTPLTGRLLVCDGESMEFHIIPIARDPACTVCGAAAHSACTTRGSL